MSEPTFAEALRALMHAKKLSASQLAREVWGEKTDGRGYEVARNRDRIGHYLSGESAPSKENLAKIAEVLGVPVDRLKKTLPAPLLRASDQRKNVQVTLNDDDTGVLTANKVALSKKTILKIIDLIENDLVQEMERFGLN